MGNNEGRCPSNTLQRVESIDPDKGLLYAGDVEEDCSCGFGSDEGQRCWVCNFPIVACFAHSSQQIVSRFNNEVFANPRS